MRLRRGDGGREIGGSDALSAAREIWFGRVASVFSLLPVRSKSLEALFGGRFVPW